MNENHCDRLVSVSQESQKSSHFFIQQRRNSYEKVRAVSIERIEASFSRMKSFVRKQS